MNSNENLYCRFCAEPKSCEKLLDLQSDVIKQGEIVTKLAVLNAMYIDILNRDSLPKTICLVCYESLNKAYDFFERVKRAQHVLSTLFTPIEVNKDPSDDENYDDFLSNIEDVPVKTELESAGSTSVLVKQELKEEKEEDFGNSLNVDEILDAALRYSSNVTIYAKEVADMTKKDVLSWVDYPWICALCSIEFMSVELLRSHASMVHGKCSAFFCVDCKQARKDDFCAFVKHVRKHRKCLRNYCYYCNSQHDNMIELKAHVKQHHIKPQIPCPLCGEVLKNDEDLKLHIRQYGAIKQKRRPRRKAGQPITIEELTCDLCKKVYKNPNSLRDHMKLHTIDRKRDYTCERCGKMFYNKGTLTSHIMSHDKVRPHLCRICNKTFLFPNMLRRHVEMHSGVKPFSCEQCGRCFRLQYQLNAHKIVHTDSMPYVCQYCNKAFRFKQILKNHERQHTGMKPYSCQNCGMEFTNWSNYNKHMKRRHGTDTSKKKITPEGVFPINPETGQIIQIGDPEGTAEWKSKIMIPGKRGKKKAIKEENVA